MTSKPAAPRGRWPEAREAVPALVKALKDRAARVRRGAVRSLGLIGPAAKSAIEDIRQLPQDKDEKVRKATRTSLQQVDPPPADTAG